MRKGLFATVVLFGTLAVTWAFAKTPDGQTPADEVVCDVLKGAAFGLCNAYCEAKDCDAQPKANQRACDQLRSNYTKKTGLTEFPCDCRAPFVFDTDAGCVCAPVLVRGCEEQGGEVDSETCECVLPPPPACEPPFVFDADAGCVCDPVLVSGCEEQGGQVDLKICECVLPPSGACQPPLTCSEFDPSDLCGACGVEAYCGTAALDGSGICFKNAPCEGRAACPNGDECPPGYACVTDTCCLGRVCLEICE